MKICFNGQQQYVLFLLLFQPIERVAKKFNPLHIPKRLQRDLPFKSKPKNELKQKKKTYEQKRAVIMETDEKKVSVRVFTYNPFTWKDVEKDFRYSC